MRGPVRASLQQTRFRRHHGGMHARKAIRADNSGGCPGRYTDPSPDNTRCKRCRLSYDASPDCCDHCCRSRARHTHSNATGASERYTHAAAN